VTQIGVRPIDGPEGLPDIFGEPKPPAPPAEPGEAEGEEPVPVAPDLSQARSLLTELVPAGMGEVLVTDIWARPEPKKPPKADDEPVDRQRLWELRQEMRDLGLLKERPIVTYDARVEQYWGQVKDAREQAPTALMDPYSELVMLFAGVDLENMAELRRNAQEYGREADSLLCLGRAYMAIGKFKGARQVFQAAAKAEPQHPDVWWHLGVTNVITRANRDAARALENAVDQSPGDFRAEMGLGLARYHLRDYEGAEQCFRRLAGNEGLRASARSMLACSLRMQHKWDNARVELKFLGQSSGGDWPAVADQCVDCVERGEQKKEGPLRRRRRIQQMLKTLAAAAGGGIWVAYARAENLFRDQAPYAAIPVFLAALVLVRGLRGISGREMPGEFGNAEQGLPCWQTTTWMKPRRSEF
jgi:tetratricopeptide (TPR) repeat protein